MKNRMRNSSFIFESNLGRLIVVILLVYFVIFCAIPRQGFALNGKDHIKVWNAVVGVQRKESKDIVKNCWKVFQAEIDKVDGDSPFYSDFKDYFKKKYKIEIKRCSHRVFFHWGYEANPDHIKAIMEKCIYFKNNGETIRFVDFPKYVDSSKKGKDINEEIIDYLTRANAKRNRKMIKAVKGTWFRRRKQASPFAGIIYDVHILGDWQTPATKALLPPEELAKEINGYIEKLFRSQKGHQLGKEINKKLKHASSSGNNDQDRAKEMLNILTTNFPTALSNEYGSKLEANGIVINSKNNTTLTGQANRFLRNSLNMFGKNQ